VVGAEHDLAGADLRHLVAQRLRREHQRVEMQLVAFRKERRVVTVFPPFDLVGSGDSIGAPRGEI
jgi:hypothetical protein